MSGTTMALAIYVLIWPVIVAIVLAVLAGSFSKEWAAARKEGRDLV
jgi:ABC-type dipeptide/oligopeptide/nickel transport system permease component